MMPVFRRIGSGQCKVGIGHVGLAEEMGQVMELVMMD
jgi:hypothetical protein